MTPIRYATICSGIECCSVALDGMGWEPVFFSEIDPNPSAILAHRYPHVPNLGDMTKIHFDGKEVTNGTTRIALHGTLDLLAGGTPCTDVSTIGKRGGMAEGSGTASSLAFDYVRLVRELKPQWILWENVEGVFSSHGGRDFGSFLEALAASGYVLSWRVLSPEGVRTDRHPDGIPQRRRRVWLVGHRGDDPRVPEAVLSLGSGLPGSFGEGRAQKEEDDPGVEGGSSGAGREDGEGGRVDLPAILKADHVTLHPYAGPIVGDHDSSVGDMTNLLAQTFADTFNGLITGADSPPVTARTGLPDASGPKVLAVNIHNAAIAGEIAPAVTTETGGGGRSGPKVLALSSLDQRVSETAQCLSGCHASCDHIGAVWQNATIRRITPFEAERLMGLPDGYTLVPVKRWRKSSPTDKAHILAHCPEYADAKFWRTRNGKLQTLLLADGPRFKACGNGWATNCARWILKRIETESRRISKIPKESERFHEIPKDSPLPIPLPSSYSSSYAHSSSYAIERNTKKDGAVAPDLSSSSEMETDTAQKATQDAQEHGGAPQGGNHAPNALDALPDASPLTLGASGDARPADREGPPPSPRLGSSAPVLFWQGGGGVPRKSQVTRPLTRAGGRVENEA